MARIKLEDSFADAMCILSDGNPGALTFMFNMITIVISPMELMKILFKLDESEIYGSHIYMIWNDCCDRDTEKAIKMIKNLSTQELRSYVIGLSYGKKYIENE